MRREPRVYVAGHTGLVGSALLRRLQAEGGVELVTRTHAQLDLTAAPAVEDFFARERPDFVYLAAARVGGILANATRPAEFLRDNLAIQTHVIHAAWRHGVKKLLFLGSSCIYPRLAPQPLREEALLSGPLEPTNEAYAVAKIAGIKMCAAYNRQYGTDFLCVMPTNLYGPHDNFDLESSHVVPALMRKMHEAKAAGRREVVVWGSGRPRRELLHSDDLADACVHLMRTQQARDLGEFVNVGTGTDLTIRELAETIAAVTGFAGALAFDRSQPDGTPQKLLDVSRLQALGWQPRIGLEEGLRSTYRWFVEHVAAREEGAARGDR